MALCMGAVGVCVCVVSVNIHACASALEIRQFICYRVWLKERQANLKSIVCSGH